MVSELYSKSRIKGTSQPRSFMIQPRMNLGLSLAAIALTLSGCGAGVAGQGGESAPDPDLSTPDGFHEAVAHARCDHAASCCERLSEPFDDARCRAAALTEWTAIVHVLGSDHVVFHPDRARSCITALQAA